ncbi:uncharacterized protein METZ01_LOCUS31314, partial [marine metagenome]
MSATILAGLSPGRVLRLAARSLEGRPCTS